MNALQRCPACAAWVEDLIGHMCEHAPDARVTTILALVRPLTITTNASPTVAEPLFSSLATLDAATALAGEVRRWREADRLFPADCIESQEATERLRDVADRLFVPVMVRRVEGQQ